MNIVITLSWSFNTVFLILCKNLQIFTLVQKVGSKTDLLKHLNDGYQRFANITDNKYKKYIFKFAYSHCR